MFLDNQWYDVGGLALLLCCDNRFEELQSFENAFLPSLSRFGRVCKYCSLNPLFPMQRFPTLLDIQYFTKSLWLSPSSPMRDCVLCNTTLQLNIFPSLL